MKTFWKGFIAFAAWCVIMLSAFMLVVLSLVPGLVVSKVVIVIACVLIIVCAVAVRIFDPAFIKHVTTANGN